jgi:putative heme iron utilization protein
LFDDVLTFYLSCQFLVMRAVALEVNGSSANGASPAATTEEGLDWVDNIRLNVFEKAKTVASVCTSGTLCTVSGHEGIEGAPFGSFVDYVLDDQGNPVVLMNEMSMHTLNIQKNALSGNEGGTSLVTLFTQLSSDTTASRKGQDVSRCSLTCRVEKIDPMAAQDMDIIRMRYSLTHTYADQVMDSPKFHFYRLLPEKIYFVGGFGVLAKWVDVQDYRDAAPDILAREASQIVNKINFEFEEDLERTAKYILGVDSLESIRATSVDRLGMDVRVTRKQGTRRNKLSTDEFRIGFRIPVISVEDAKSEILKVFQEAWEMAEEITWGDEEIPGDTVPILKIAADSLE